ncbi:MAG TPA: sensory rhodopsin transducer [Spongiibacteraceae bacterium]
MPDNISTRATYSGVAIGRTCWAVAEGYIPPHSHGAGPDLESHEVLCVLNTGVNDAKVELTIFFEDRAPAGPYRFTVLAQRTRHLRLNTLRDPEPIPKNTPFSSLLISDVPIVVQHSRLDSRQAELALLSTIAFPV